MSPTFLNTLYVTIFQKCHKSHRSFSQQLPSITGHVVMFRKTVSLIFKGVVVKIYPGASRPNYCFAFTLLTLLHDGWRRLFTLGPLPPQFKFSCIPACV